jgi:hypothetical protein
LSEFVLDPAAKAVPANATDANNIATLFSFFMFILKIDTTAQAVRRRVVCKLQINSWADCATVVARVHFCADNRACEPHIVALLRQNTATPLQSFYQRAETPANTLRRQSPSTGKNAPLKAAKIGSCPTSKTWAGSHQI